MLKFVWLVRWISRAVKRQPHHPPSTESDRADISKSLAGQVSDHLKKDMGGQ